MIDALDECRDDGMAALLRLIVRKGSGHPSQAKWFLTSRPLDSAERELARLEGLSVSLELNAQHISRGVDIYISEKIAELHILWGYDSELRRRIGQRLGQKAGDTFL